MFASQNFRTLAYSFFCLIYFSSCSPSNLQDYQKSGEVLLDKIAKELSSIRKREQLDERKTLLKKQFRKLSSLMIEAANFQRKTGQDPIEPLSFVYSDRLYYEMLRVSEEVDGAKLFFEELQHEMLDKLDVDLRKNRKKGRQLNLK